MQVEDLELKDGWKSVWGRKKTQWFSHQRATRMNENTNPRAIIKSNTARNIFTWMGGWLSETRKGVRI